MPLESTAENPLPVRTVANAIGQWIARLGQIWVEGQLTEISKRPGTNTAFLTLRDPIADMPLRDLDADRRDVAGALEADQRAGVRGRWVAAFALQDVRPVHAGGGDPDQHLVGARCRHGRSLRG